jgi:hypothetical protein
VSFAYPGSWSLLVDREPIGLAQALLRIWRAESFLAFLLLKIVVEIEDSYIGNYEQT